MGKKTRYKDTDKTGTSFAKTKSIGCESIRTTSITPNATNYMQQSMTKMSENGEARLNDVLREEDFIAHETSSETTGPRLYFKKRPVPYPQNVLQRQLI